MSTGTSKIFFKKCRNPPETHETPVSPLLSQNVEEAISFLQNNTMRTVLYYKRKTFIFHLLIIRSVSGVLHICESKCFILWNDSGTMLHLKRRFMKHGFAVWSTFCACELCSSSIKIYEAPLDSGMKRSLSGFMFFCLDQGKKNGRPFLLKLENSLKLKWLQVNEKWLPLR